MRRNTARRVGSRTAYRQGRESGGRLARMLVVAQWCRPTSHTWVNSLEGRERKTSPPGPAIGAYSKGHMAPVPASVKQAIVAQGRGRFIFPAVISSLQPTAPLAVGASCPHQALDYLV